MNRVPLVDPFSRLGLHALGTADNKAVAILEAAGSVGWRVCRHVGVATPGESRAVSETAESKAIKIGRRYKRSVIVRTTD